MLLWQVDWKLVEYISGVALKCAEESAVAVHHNEAELVVVGEQCGQGLGMEFIITEV